MGSVPESCVGPESEAAGKADSCAGCPNQAACQSGEAREGAEETRSAEKIIAARLGDVRHTVLVLSGKGGVGKSSVAAQLAQTLAVERRARVGVLDVDICGPSQPRMLGVEGHEVHRSAVGWSPVYARPNLSVMSVGFMLQSRDDAVVWRGPRKSGLIRQFLGDVDWGSLDWLIVDTPPGTSDEHLSVVQYLKEKAPDGAIVVTTPQEVALLDVRKEINFCRKVGVPILGVIENMSGFVCPCCQAATPIFVATTGGARKMCVDMDVPFLGSLPLDPRLLECCDSGRAFTEAFPDTPASIALHAIFETLFKLHPQLQPLSCRQHADDDDDDSDADQTMVL